MTLRERRGSLEVVHQDEEKLNHSRWGKLLGVAGPTVTHAVYSCNVKVEEFPITHRRGIERLTPISEFPRLIAALGRSSHNKDKSKKMHPWAAKVDISGDFEVTTPSGITLIYEYPHNNVIFRVWRKAVRKVARR